MVAVVIILEVPYERYSIPEVGVEMAGIEMIESMKVGVDSTKQTHFAQATQFTGRGKRCRLD